MGDRKDLSTLALATLTTGIVLVHGFAGVGEAAEWVMGHPVWTHELPRLGDEIKARILAQVPDLPTQAADDWQSTAEQTLAKFGPTISIEQGDAVRFAGPVETLEQMIGEQ